MEPAWFVRCRPPSSPGPGRPPTHAVEVTLLGKQFFLSLDSLDLQKLCLLLIMIKYWS